MGNRCIGQGAGALCSVMAWRGGIGSAGGRHGAEEGGDVCILRADSHQLYGRSQHNIVKQLSPIKKNPAVFSCTGSLRKKYESQLFNNRVVLVQGFS